MELLNRWNEGGAGMYPIALAGLVGLAILVERALYLFVKARMSQRGLLDGVRAALETGGVDAALQYVAGQRDTPLTRLTKSALMDAHHGPEDVEAALDGACLREVPRLDARTGYLAMLGNAAMLAGLLGTVSGLIDSFHSVAAVKAAERATVLSGSISEAMNCTFFGLSVAIPMLVGYSVLSGRARALTDELNQMSAALKGLLSGKNPGP